MHHGVGAGSAVRLGTPVNAVTRQSGGARQEVGERGAWGPEGLRAVTSALSARVSEPPEVLPVNGDAHLKTRLTSSSQVLVCVHLYRPNCKVAGKTFVF